MAFIRMYGMEGDPGPRPAPKRKSAAAGPRAKASRKRVVRSRRAARGGNVPSSKAPGKKAKGGGIDWGAAARDFGMAMIPGGKLVQAGVAAGRSILGGGRAPGLGGGGRRSMNYANIKALRRGMRRFEGFAKIVNRVNKFMPTGAKFHRGAHTSSSCGCARKGKRR